MIGSSKYIEDLVNDCYTGSQNVQMVMFPEAFETLYSAYMEVFPSTEFTLDDFDPLLGIDKYTREAITGLTILGSDEVPVDSGETPVDLTSSVGIPLLGGSEGSIDTSLPADDRQAALDALYLKAFNQQIDPNIKSRFRYPTTFIFDANYPVNVKLAIASLVTQRTDCVGILDFGLDITTKASIGNYYTTNFSSVIDSRYISYEPYAMKVRDPYSRKVIKVTSTYWMIGAYIRQINSNNGKHRPMAGNTYGIISGYIGNSVYPVFDEAIDETMMDDYSDKNLNYARYNQNQVVVRGSQNTAQNKLSALTELNNVLVLLDIKRDCEALCSTYEYDFADADDISRFNRDISNVTDKYAEAQVKRISATFSQNSWEAERSIVHLNVEMVCRNLAKTFIIEIDVNRDE